MYDLQLLPESLQNEQGTHSVRLRRSEARVERRTYPRYEDSRRRHSTGARPAERKRRTTVTRTTTSVPRTKKRRLSDNPDIKRSLKSKSVPGVYRRGNVFYLVENEASQYKLPRAIVITMLVVVACALVIVLTNSQITSVERQISAHTVELRALQDQRMAEEARMMARYTLEEIEYIAFVHLGLIYPDPSQIIEIFVQPENVISMNRHQELIPVENFFWADIRSFISGLFNQVFGGS